MRYYTAPVDMLAGILAENITGDRNDFDEIEIDGIYYSFDLRDEEEHETRYTGVEFMGARETYVHTTHSVGIQYIGAYDQEGEDVTPEINMTALLKEIEAYSDDYNRINAYEMAA